MKKKSFIYKSLVAAICVFSVCSCDRWLDVEMEDSIMEKTLYASNEGYLTSLNGVYSKMNEVYSSTLSMGVVDAMAQYYSIAKNNEHQYYKFANFDFKQEGFENMSSHLWAEMYQLIANLNTIIEHCDEENATIKPQYYSMVKGEALGLRAMMHFDLLRLYGPIYSEETKNQQSIPYYNTSDKKVKEILPAHEALEYIINDLTQASELLQNDSVRTYGVMEDNNDTPGSNLNFRYRQYRLNYYAVQALLARAYLWENEKEKAYRTAKGIIEENNKKEVFKWTPKNRIQDSREPDRIFSSEVFFAMYNPKRQDLYDQLFKEDVDVNHCLAFPGSELDSEDSKLLTFYSDKDDLRRGANMWQPVEFEKADEATGSTTSHMLLCYYKYAPISTPALYKYMIPLIRLSEIYLIAAETAPDTKEAVGYVNEVRKHRNCINLPESIKDKDELKQYIMAEFAREEIGEGQLFFYYKRNAMEELPSGTDAKDTFKMALKNYVWPLPKAEIDKRVSD